jgi:hypothetical protein
MQIRIVAVPAGGEDADYCLEMECPGAPAIGDYIIVRPEYRSTSLQEDQLGTEDFIVRRIRWGSALRGHGWPGPIAGARPADDTGMVELECDMAIGAFSSPAHLKAAGKDAPKHDLSVYRQLNDLDWRGRKSPALACLPISSPS